jgi:hypothetical protein
MSQRRKLQELLKSLLVEDAQLFEDGDWEGLAQVRMSIDAVRDQLTLEDDRDTEHTLLINESEHNQ